MVRPRFLVLAEEKGLAETILKALGAMSDLDPEVEVTLQRERVSVEVSDRRFDLVVVGAQDVDPSGLLAAVPGDLPCVVVADQANGTPSAAHVPLPLSYNLLRLAVLDALSGRSSTGSEAADRRLRDLG